MFEIDGYGITLTRGDSFRFEVRLKGRVIANGSLAVFTVKERAADAAAVLEKVALVKDRRAGFELLPEDTEGLRAKGYRWSLRIIDGDGNVYTPIADELLLITEVIA